MWLGQVGRGRGLVLACIDDLQWADGPSARALLFAIRRLQADQVLVVLSARAGELPGLGEGWPRFVTGDHRARPGSSGRAGTRRCGGAGPGTGAGEFAAPRSGDLAAWHQGRQGQPRRGNDQSLPGHPGPPR